MEHVWNNLRGLDTGSELVFKSRVIADDIERKIDRGGYKEKLPTVRAIASEYKVNVKTVSKALALLVESGSLEVIHGSGIFISARKKKTDGMLVALFLQPQGHVNEPLYSTLCRLLRERNYFPLLSSDESRQSSRREIDRVMALSPHAVVIERDFLEFDYPYLKEKENEFRHIIFALRDESGIEFEADCVVSSPWHGSYQAATHLLKKGHRRVAFLINEWTYDPARYRTTDHFQFVQGYRAALKEHGVETDEMVFCEKSNSHEDARRFEEMMASPHRPTALLANSDFRIINQYPVLRKLGLRVPDDVELFGYNNTPWSQGDDLAFSSVSIREKDIAQAVVSKILSGKGQSTRTVIEPELVIRSSSR